MKTTLAALVAFATFTQFIQGAPQDSNRRLTVEEYEVTMNHFTQQFLIEVGDEEGQNLVFSPFNLHTALSVLTSAATDGTETQRQLLDALGNVQNIQGLENRYKQLLENYMKPEVQQILTFGTRFWTAKNYNQKIKDAFRQKLDEVYKAEILQLAEQNPEQDINDWVKEVTHGKIEEIIQSVDDEAKFLIVTALYLNAAWTKNFQDIKEPQAFTLLDGEQTLVNMMVRNDSYQNWCSRFQFRDKDYTAVAIPYQAPNDNIVNPSPFEMVIIMPDDHRELRFLQAYLKRQEENVDINIFDAAQSALQDPTRKKITILMPSFTIDSEVSVDTYFKRMGITAPFDEGGFERIIADEPLKVNKINHRATMEVTKEGTVGAAATIIEIASFSADFNEATEVIINKPFIFYLRDTAEKTILFAGKYVNPYA